jgi:putative intracellular protease/amidase
VTPAVHVLVFDGFADWEPAFALAELRRSGGLDVVTVGFTQAEVRSMGGLRVVPDRSLAGLSPSAVRLLLLPGGDLWEGSYPRAELDAVLTDLSRAGVPIAAICGATLAVARAGVLDDRAHTSNELAYLQRMVPEYAGAGRYVDALAVRDRGLITASGAGPTEFAREIFEELEVFSASDRQVWYHLFKHGRFPAGRRR